MGRGHRLGRAPLCAGFDKFSLHAAVRWHSHLVGVSMLEFMQRIVALVPGPRLRLTGCPGSRLLPVTSNGRSETVAVALTSGR